MIAKDSSFVSGGRGIRTPGTSRYNGFQDRRIRPLCHSSDAKLRRIFGLTKSPSRMANATQANHGVAPCLHEQKGDDANILKMKGQV